MPDNPLFIFVRYGKGGPKGNDLLRIIHQLHSQLNLNLASLDFFPTDFPLTQGGQR